MACMYLPYLRNRKGERKKKKKRELETDRGSINVK